MKKFILILAAALTLASACTPNEGIPSNKKEVIDRFIAGTLDDSYVPAAFFSHFKAREGDAAVAAHLEFFLATNSDILKVQFEQRASRVKLETEEDWNNIEMLPEDFYAPTLEIIKKLQETAGKDVYVLPTIYNPHQVARQSLTEKNIVEAAKNHPEILKKVLDNYKTALLWLVRECKAIGIEGFYMTTQGGEKKFYEIPGDFYGTYIKPYDLEIMGECCKDTKCNILHICDWEGTHDDLTRFADYPAQIINTPFNLDGTFFSLEDGVKLFGRPVLGGLDRKGEINNIDGQELYDFCSKVIDEGPKGKTMLGAECTVNVPYSKINTAISAAHNRD